ncbi:hypothetical protein K2Q00_02410 [Patescibacteria group bacterium]|nr:hypothetical protein [Patescibacteria group bacterium]
MADLKRATHHARSEDAKRLLAPGEIHSLNDLLEELGGQEVLDRILQGCRDEFGDEEVDLEGLTDYIRNNQEPFADVNKPNLSSGSASDEDAARQRTVGQIVSHMYDLIPLIIAHWQETGVLVVEDEASDMYVFAEPE